MTYQDLPKRVRVFCLFGWLGGPFFCFVFSSVNSLLSFIGWIVSLHLVHFASFTYLYDLNSFLLYHQTMYFVNLLIYYVI